MADAKTADAATTKAGDVQGSAKPAEKPAAEHDAKTEGKPHQVKPDGR